MVRNQFPQRDRSFKQTPSQIRFRSPSNALPQEDMPGPVERRSRPRRPSPPAPVPPPEPPRRAWGWAVHWLGLLGLAGGLGVAAFVWMLSLPPLPNCKTIDRTAIDSEQLYCAQQAARSGKLERFLQAIELLKHWSPQHPQYDEARQLLNDLSTPVMLAARDQIAKGDFVAALATANRIPRSSPIYAEAQDFMQHWQQVWAVGHQHYTTAQTALKAQNWREAAEQVAILRDMENDYWRTQQADRLSKQLTQEKKARQLFATAQALAKNSPPSQLGRAIAAALKVPSDTYTAIEVQQSLQQWSQQVLSVGIAKWQAGYATEAIEILQAPFAEAAAVPEVQDLWRFGQAYQRVGSNSLDPEQLNLALVFNRMEAIAALNQVQPSSPFYEQAQAASAQWQQQIQDISQTQYAIAVASLGQRSSYDLAAAQLRQLGTDRPLPAQAQALATEWTRAADRLEDEAQLAQADRRVAGGTVTDLQAAIATAQQIDLKRELRSIAQTRIAAWGKQIQILQDQPLLDQAKRLAAQQKWGEAIRTASTIKMGRALYAEARSAVVSWQAQQTRLLQIAQDQPILERAKAKAAQGHLSQAVAIATKILPGRALYNDAQDEIAAWNASIAAYYAQQAAENADAYQDQQESYENGSDYSSGNDFEDGSSYSSEEDSGYESEYAPVDRSEDWSDSPANDTTDPSYDQGADQDYVQPEAGTDEGYNESYDESYTEPPVEAGSSMNDAYSGDPPIAPPESY